MGLDGSNPELIVSKNARRPTLSPDGLEIAFFGHNEAFTQNCIYVMSIDGGDRWPAYCGGNTSFNEEGLSFSPDGKEIAFSASKSGTVNKAILKVNLITEAVTVVADWYQDQAEPSFSPDGTHIAFTARYTAGKEFAPGIWTVNKNGTELTRLTSEWQEEPAWSPDGEQIAVEGFNEEHEEDEGGIALLNAETGEIEEWLFDEDGPWEYNPSWSSDGRYIYATEYIEEPERHAILKVKPDGTGEEDLLPLWHWAAEPQAQAAIAPEFDPEYLLTRYEPTLYYDKQEQYFADSADEAVDGPANFLYNVEKAFVVAGHEPEQEPLTLSTLSYGNEDASHGWLVEGENYEEDAAEMHAQPKYGDRAYGRITQAESGRWWLQYWFYYYYDDQEVLGLGKHEGDWETVAYRLSEDGIPEEAVYSRHGDETAACGVYAVRWEMSDWTTASPIVYVANGSHANYFTPGEHGRSKKELPTDDANGDGATRTPIIQQVSSDTVASQEGKPEWFYWNGHWGNSGETPFVSPESPARDANEWEDVELWSEEHEEDCDVEESPVPRFARVKPSGPDEPEISAKQSGSAITIHYSIPGRGATAKRLLVSVSAKYKPDATRSDVVVLHGNHGVGHLPLPFAPGPYVASASSYTEGGDRSDTASVPVQP